MRSERDMFYKDELLNMTVKMQWFEYTQYLSRPENLPLESENTKLEIGNTKPATVTGYVTEWITEAYIREYQEFYICGSPAMVESARNKLTSLGIAKEVIYWEQY